MLCNAKTKWRRRITRCVRGLYWRAQVTAMVFEALTMSLSRWEWLGQLLARISVGLLFFLSGRGKLFVEARRESMRNTMRQAGVPFPELTAGVTSGVEFVFGATLVVGLFTPVSCLLLIGVMVGALATTLIPAL